MATTCSRCAHENLPEANFCSSCGAPLSDILDAPTEALKLDEINSEHERQSDQPLVGFQVARGPKAGSRYELDPGITSIGRHPDSDIFLDDITVSRRHVEAHFAEGQVLVSDAESLNGTYVNRKMIDQATKLAHGDELQIGKFKLQFFSEPRS